MQRKPPAVTGKRAFVLDQPGAIGRLGEEVSPYTQAPLGISYPRADLDRLFSAARTAMDAGWAQAEPELLGLTTAERDLYGEERFGPISFCIETMDADDALRQATTDVKQIGGLTAFLYSTDAAYIARAEAAYARAGAQLTQSHRPDAAQLRRRLQRLPGDRAQPGRQCFANRDGVCRQSLSNRTIAPPALRLNQPYALPAATGDQA